MRVFISYSHAQADWVHDRLEPCLRAGGAEVLIDHRRFVAGPALVGQMDALQDQADRHVLVITADYLASAACQHEMNRAIQLDPGFTTRLVIPVRRDTAPLPPSITIPNSLYADLTDDKRPDPWQQLLVPCNATLGTPAPDWLAARDEILQWLRDNQSVNLVVHGSGPLAWRGLLDDVAARLPPLPHIDLDDGACASRRGLVEAMLTAIGAPAQVPPRPEDLVHLSQKLETLNQRRLVWRHCDRIARRTDYEVDLFAALRYAVMDRRQLVLLLQSRAPFATLLPASHELSHLHLATVELVSQP